MPWGWAVGCPSPGFLSIIIEKQKTPAKSGGWGERRLTPIEAAGRSGRSSSDHSTPVGAKVQRNSPLTSKVMSVLKAILKVLFVLVLVGIVAGVVKVQMKSKDADPVSFDEWPDVPRNPASE
jgi:hypothetical protein